MWEVPPLDQLLISVQDPSNPIGMRMRAAYFLRSIFPATEGNEEQGEREKQDSIILALSNGLGDQRQGSLMRHEFAYVMGQLRDERCCPALEDVLQRQGDCSMVRHEAAEALGAIGAERSTAVISDLLEKSGDLPVELAETCHIALDVMVWRKNGGDAADMPVACACMLNPYYSADPAPPHPSHANMSMPEIGKILSDTSLPLFERYRAMFSLRNIGGEDAVKELCRVLVEDESSALLRHEVAYVLGQMQHPFSVEALEQSLRRSDEHKMVRHESAEALGAIEGRWDDVVPILNEFSQDENDVVRESCLVALDAADYWGHNKHQEASDDSPDPLGASTASEDSASAQSAATFARVKAERIHTSC